MQPNTYDNKIDLFRRFFSHLLLLCVCVDIRQFQFFLAQNIVQNENIDAYKRKVVFGKENQIDGEWNVLIEFIYETLAMYLPCAYSYFSLAPLRFQCDVRRWMGMEWECFSNHHGFG